MKKQNSSIHQAVLLNQQGIALLYLIILFVLMGVLVSAVSRILTPLTVQRKVTDTKAEMERDVQTITAWVVKKGRLPSTGGVAALFGSAPADAWGRPLVYAYYSTATGGICGRSSSDITYNGKDVAFMLLSGGEDMTINSTPAISGSYTGALSTPGSGDIYQIVTLNELQALAGCPVSTQGILAILNNELPKACRYRSYSAAIYGSGGVGQLFYTSSTLPSGITRRNQYLSATGTTAATNRYQVEITATDSLSSVKRKYFLNVTTCF